MEVPIMSNVPPTSLLQPFLTDDKPINLEQDDEIQMGRSSTWQPDSPLSTPAEPHCDQPMQCNRELHKRILADLGKWVD